jgi:2,5-diamino-6-(ribosylamino)-4(3H)-pyrimidinone 5'-phosphate reductase
MPRPYVVVNVAASIDGKIDTVERRGAAISSAQDRQRVDVLRASVDGVMVGGHTLVDEDPRLTVKSADLRAARLVRGVPANPAKIAVVSHLRIDPAGRFVTAGPARIIVFIPAVQAESHSQGAMLRQSGVEIFRLGDGRVDLTAAMSKLAELGMRRVLVEGGGSLNFELLRLGLVDEVQLFIGPLIFGGATAPTLADGAGLASKAAVRLKRVDVDLGEDGGIVLRYKVEQRE